MAIFPNLVNITYFSCSLNNYELMIIFGKTWLCNNSYVRILLNFIRLNCVIILLTRLTVSGYENFNNGCENMLRRRGRVKSLPMVQSL